LICDRTDEKANLGYVVPIESVADHELLRERSRKRLMKYAAKEFKRGLDAQKVTYEGLAVALRDG
jgi:hypothetical protein